MPVLGQILAFSQLKITQKLSEIMNYISNLSLSLSFSLSLSLSLSLFHVNELGGLGILYWLGGTKFHGLWFGWKDV